MRTCVERTCAQAGPSTTRGSGAQRALRSVSGARLLARRPVAPAFRAQAGRGRALAAAAAASNAGMLISKTEIPAFIPRDDLVDQLVRWAYIESQGEALASYGMPFKVEEVFREDDGRLWGANLSFLRNGQPVTTIYFGFDEASVAKHEWLGMDDLGFPVPEGKKEDVLGQHFEIRKVCDSAVDEELRASIRAVCKALVGTINKYYAFGSVFADDAT